jgi:hypothetical protein
VAVKGIINLMLGESLLSKREASNLSEVRFGEVAVLKQILVLHRKNS